MSSAKGVSVGSSHYDFSLPVPSVFAVCLGHPSCYNTPTGYVVEAKYMKKRVILNLRQSTETIGGAEVVIRRTVGALDKNSYDVTICCLHKPGRDLSAVRESLAQTGATFCQIEDRKLFDMKSWREVLAMIAELKPDVVHCHEPKTDFYGFLLRIFKPRLKIVSTLHGWTQASSRGRLYKKLDLFFARFFHGLIAVSPLIESEARQKGLNKVRLIENGIPVSYWRGLVKNSDPPIVKQPGERWVGFVGRLSREKGAVEFIETASRIAAKREDVTFVIAGDGPLLQEMKDLADHHGISARCRFLGLVKLDNMPGLLKNLDVLLSTSATEGLPNILLEAGALGIPMVATAVGGVPRVIQNGENGFLSAFQDHEALANQCLDLLDDQALHQRISKATYAYIEETFDISVTASKLGQLYQDVQP